MMVVEFIHLVEKRRPLEMGRPKPYPADGRQSGLNLKAQTGIVTVQSSVWPGRCRVGRPVGLARFRASRIVLGHERFVVGSNTELSRVCSASRAGRSARGDRPQPPGAAQPELVQFVGPAFGQSLGRPQAGGQSPKRPQAGWSSGTSGTPSRSPATRAGRQGRDVCAHDLRPLPSGVARRARPGRSRADLAPGCRTPPAGG